MSYIEFFAQLFVLTFAIFAGLLLAFRLIWPKIENYVLKINSLNQSKSFAKDQLQLRFSAYERLILLIHRISPHQVMLRNHSAQLSLTQFRQAVIADIENEFQHNFTQQLYVSDAAWIVVKDLKDRTISLLRNANKGLPEHATQDDYIAVVLRHLKELEVDPYDAAQVLLKRELSV